MAFFYCTLITALNRESCAHQPLDCHRFEDGFYSHATECQHYWKCTDGVAELQTCPNGQGFRQSASKCDYLYNINCYSKLYPYPIHSDPHCLFLNGIYPDEENCDTYWNCTNGEATRQQCPPGYLYNSRFHTCKPDSQRDCQRKQLSQGCALSVLSPILKNLAPLGSCIPEDKCLLGKAVGEVLNECPKTGEICCLV